MSLHDTQNHTCPFYYNQNTNNENRINTNKGQSISVVENLKRICQWPLRLTLNVNATQAEFSQEWQTYSAGWLTLPGNAKHWPQSVQINNTQVL